MNAPKPIATSENRAAWLEKRRGGVTATDMAKLGHGGGTATLRRIIEEKRGEAAAWAGNAAAQHGRDREPEIAAWIERESARGRFGSGALVRTAGLFAHPEHPRHLASPDGLSADWEFSRESFEIKTTDHAWSSIPRDYLRQVWWQQYVLGAERTLVVWERHENYVPVDLEPSWQWVKRDQHEIDALVTRAAELLEFFDREAPLAPKDIDVRIGRYLRLRDRRAVIDAQMQEIEEYLRNRAGSGPLTAFGTLGDLSISAPTSSMRFSQAALAADHPDLVEAYKRPVEAKGRFTITPVRVTAQQQETNAA